MDSIHRPARRGPRIVPFERHAARTDTQRREILYELRRRMLGLGDRLHQRCTYYRRIAYNSPGKKIFLEVKVQDAAIVLHLAEGVIPATGSIATPIPETHGWGQLTKRIKLTTLQELDAAMPEVEAAFRAINH